MPQMLLIELILNPESESHLFHMFTVPALRPLSLSVPLPRSFSNLYLYDDSRHSFP